jgi:sugar/nucleoside kinase (ribokinase family)
VTGKGERTMFGGRGCNTNPPDYQPTAEVLAGMDGLHISGYTLMDDDQFEVIARLIKDAHRQGKVISLDPGVFTANQSKQRIDSILPMVDYLLISQTELSDYSLPDDQRTGIQRLLASGIKSHRVENGGKRKPIY